MRAFDFAARAHWAIQTEVDEDGTVRAPALKNILEIALRAKEPDFEAVAQKMAERVKGSGVMEMRGQVAVLNLVGPIFRYANFFTLISGATSVSEIATAFRAAVDDPLVTGIVLNVDSPGGEVAGIGELAAAIWEARGTKPIVAFADDLMASAAYWIASAADRIVASETAMLGSVGVVATIVDRGPREGVKTYQFVSSQSPNKRPNLETDAGRATIQQMIDDIAGVFVAAVARNRGVSEDKVLSEFGQGGMLIASKAVAAGMADSIGSFEGLVTELGSVENRGPSFAPRQITGPQLAAEHAGPRSEDHSGEATWKAGIREGRRQASVILSGAGARNPTFALALLEQDLGPEVASRLLAAAPAESNTNAANEAFLARYTHCPKSAQAEDLSEQDEIVAILKAGALASGRHTA